MSDLTKTKIGHIHIYVENKVPISKIKIGLLEVRKSRNDFFKPTFPPKKRTNEFYFTTMKPQVVLFSFVFGGN